MKSEIFIRGITLNKCPSYIQKGKNETVSLAELGRSAITNNINGVKKNIIRGEGHKLMMLIMQSTYFM